MKFISHHLIIIFSLFFLGCSSTKTTTVNNIASLPGSSLQAFGRSAITNGQLELISSASQFGFGFTGKDCNLFANVAGTGHGFLQYEIDGLYQKRIRVDGSTNTPIIITAPYNGIHTVWIYKATEAHSGPIFIEKIEGKNLEVLKKPTAPIIEFIGNSITCGAAADADEYPCGTGEYQDHHNAYYAYGPRLARTLGANYILSSVSGIGIYRNWNSDGPAMPQVYEKTDFQDSSLRAWDFATYKPAIVSIALGTNDFSNGDGKKPRLPFDTTTFINSYIKFVQLVKSKYPTSQIALLSSPMVGGDKRMIFQNCLTAIKGKIDALYPQDKPVAVFFFEPMSPRGCSGHPSVDDHAILASELLPFFKKLLSI